MKTSNQFMNLQSLAMELTRQSQAKQDYLVPTTKLSVRTQKTVNRGGFNMDSFFTLPEGQEFRLTDHTHSQVATWLDIPEKYYNRLRVDYPALLDENVNTLFSSLRNTRMVRTLDNNARAFLSDRFRRFDNDELAGFALPILGEMGVNIESYDISENKFYLKAVLSKLEGEISVGDPVQMGIVISNSETGDGALVVKPLIYRLVCTNGMIRTDSALRKNHAGRSIDQKEESLFSQKTLVADEAVFVMKIRDVIKNMLSQSFFDKMISDLKEARNHKLGNQPDKSVDVLGKKFSFTDGEKSSVLNYLIQGGDLSKWGVANAVTHASQDLTSYERATQFEEFGGQIIDMSASQWKEVAQVA